MEFIYTIDPNVDEPIMLIDRHIGYDPFDGYGVMGDLFARELLALDAMEKKRIQIWINSPGGSVTEGYSIYNAILRTKTKVDTLNIGIAASITGVIFQAGRNRIMCDYGVLMYHNPYNSDGSEDDGLAAIKKSLVTMVSSRSGKTAEDVSAMMDKETWITADEALATGLCDTIEHSGEQNKKRMSTASDAKSMWRIGAEILNSAFKISTYKNQNNMSNMAKINAKLGLQPEASEEAQVNAVTALQNKVAVFDQKMEDAETRVIEAKNQLRLAGEKHESDLTQLKNDHKAAIQAKDQEIEKLKNDYTEKLKGFDDLKKKQEELAAETLKNAAEQLVKTHINAGRIRNEAEAIKQWTDRAIADLDGTKNLLETLPASKSAPVMVVNNTDKEVGSVVNTAMADLRKKINSN